jgi:GT2 family glycosyltransferase
MNTGAKKALGRYLIFLHSDTFLPEDSYEKLYNTLKKYKAGAFNLNIKSNNFFIKFIAKVSSLRSRITRIPYGDQVIFIQNDYFKTLNGYKEIPLMEDVEIMLRIKKQKEKIYILKDKVITSPRRWQKEGILFCTLRNWFLIILFFFGVSPEKLVKFYY